MEAMELKARIESYLENGKLDEFRVWFADVLRTANANDKQTRDLILQTDLALATFGSGRCDRAALHTELQKLCGRIQ